MTLPVIQKSMGDELEVRKRKAFAIVSQIVDSLYNDDIFYPDSNGYKGFSVLKTVKFEGETYSGQTKFCKLFARHFNRKLNSNVNCKVNELTFSSVDGMDWYLPVSKFNKTYDVIKIDVNGKKEPNCMYNAETCKKPDIFEYYLLSYGKLTEEKPKKNEELFPAYEEDILPPQPTKPTTPTQATKPTQPTKPPSRPYKACYNLSSCGCTGYITYNTWEDCDKGYGTQSESQDYCTSIGILYNHCYEPLQG